MGEKKRFFVDECQKFRYSKRGQLAVFALLGIVLLVVIIIMIMAANFASESKLQKQAESAVKEYVESSSLDYYVYTCMDKVVKEAVEDFSRQGGVFYKSQGGPIENTLDGVTHIPFNESLNGGVEFFNVSYAIQNTGYCPLVETTAPEYPFDKTKIDELFAKYLDSNNGCVFHTDYKYSGFIGYNNLTRICALDGENIKNSPQITSPCKVDYLTSVTRVTELSAEAQLANEIANKTQECINFTIFEQIGGHNITVIDDATSNITFTKSSFSTEITYPFLVQLKGHEPVLIRHTFKYESNLRITQIMRFLLNIITTEVQIPDFNMKEDYGGIRDFDANMDFEIIDFKDCTTCPHQNDTLLKLTDRSSKIGNKSLTFYAAIKNRIPILDYIHQTQDGDYFDIITEENTSINIFPFGIDPENYGVAYGYDGWKETEDAYFDYDGTRIDSECSLDWRLTHNKPFTTKEEILDCMDFKPGAPKNWTTSEIYVLTNQNASYIPNLSDIGVHTVNVRVFDRANLEDWQALNILVIDKPKVNLTVQAPYPNVPANFVSKEDLFILNATGSRPSMIGGGNIVKYLWEIFKTPSLTPVIQNFTEDPENFLEIPVDVSNIQTIEYFNVTESGEHRVKLTLFTDSPLTTSGQSGSNETMITVKDCIPVRDSDAAYPYNLNPDPYHSNHTCCAGTIADGDSYALAGSATVCFDQTVYGAYEIIKSYYASNLEKSAELIEYYAKEGEPSHANEPFKFNILSTDSRWNNVFKLDFERMCDNNRGNICGGEIKGVLTSDTCDFTPGLYEQCSGPSSNSYELDTKTMSCIDYAPGDTFEKNIYGTGSGFCDNDPECSTLGDGGYNVAGGYAMCKGLCDSHGGCDYTNVANCVCVKTKCGSQCDSTFTPYYSGTICYATCDVSTQCKLNPQNMPCEPGPDKSCRAGGFCYRNVECTSTGGSGAKGSACPDPTDWCNSAGKCCDSVTGVCS